MGDHLDVYDFIKSLQIKTPAHILSTDKIQLHIYYFDYNNANISYFTHCKALYVCDWFIYPRHRINPYGWAYTAFIPLMAYSFISKYTWFSSIWNCVCTISHIPDVSLCTILRCDYDGNYPISIISTIYLIQN